MVALAGHEMNPLTVSDLVIECRQRSRHGSRATETLKGNGGPLVSGQTRSTDGRSEDAPVVALNCQMDRSGPRLIDQKVFGAVRPGMDDRRPRTDAGSATCRAGLPLVLVVRGVGTIMRIPG